MRFKKEELKMMFNKKIKEGKSISQAHKELAQELDYMNKIESAARKIKNTKPFKEIFNDLKFHKGEYS